MKPALGSSPIGVAPSGTHALDVLTRGPGRRMRLLLRELRGTTFGYSADELAKRHGSNVHALINQLTAGGYVEHDGAARVRLTIAGRGLARGTR